MLKNKCQFPGTPQDGYRKTGEGQFTASGEQGIQEKVVPSAAYALSAYWRSGCRLEFTALCQQCTQRLGGRRSVKRNTIIVTYYNAPNSTLLKKTLRAVAAKTGQGRRFNNNPLAVWVKFRFLVQVGMQ